ncbi:hypothetical protein NQ317_016850 [Molorchus minor]|uniref:Transposase n=1 Tax=Molorchus minor TaxID=1323400 RepID=A0ABQ9JJL8_9CUCU|nr:hypothetical protein NQ317_016850 [Molorchus minor]
MLQLKASCRSRGPRLIVVTFQLRPYTTKKAFSNDVKKVKISQRVANFTVYRTIREYKKNGIVTSRAPKRLEDDLAL